MSQDKSVTPRACQTPPRGDQGAPPFRKIVGEEPVTPATTTLQPETTTVLQQGSMHGAQSTAIQSGPLNGQNHEQYDSREQSTAHTLQTGDSSLAAETMPIIVQNPLDSTLHRGSHCPDEWERMTVPAEWAPAPVFKVTVPTNTTADQLSESLTELLLKHFYKIKSVHFDTPAPDEDSVGIIRLESGQVDVEAESSAQSDRDPFQFTTDVVAIAKHAADTINDAASPENPKVLNATAENVQVCMCLANVPATLQSVSAMTSALQPFGSLERVCMICNPNAEVKGYAIVEFTLPSQAKRAYDKLRYSSMVNSCGLQPAERPDPPKDGSMDDLCLPASLLVSWSHARNVSECFSKVLFLTHVPDAYLVLDDQLSNTLAHAAQCTPDDISEVFTHKVVSDSLSLAHLADSRDARCGRSWGCVRFTRADHCDAAFRKLHEREERGDNALRVVFAPPDFMAWHGATCNAAVSALPGIGISGPGFAPGCDQDAIQERFKSPAKPQKSGSGVGTPATNGVPNEQSMNGADLQASDKVVPPACIYHQQGGEAAVPVSKNRKDSLGTSAPKTSQVASGRGKSNKGRQSARTGSLSKSGRHGKRSQRGGHLPKPRLLKPPQHLPIQYGPSNTLGNSAGATVLPGGFIPVPPQPFPPGPLRVRSMMALDPGLHAQTRHIPQSPSNRHSSVIHQAPRPPPVHMSCHPAGATWVQQPSATPVLSNTCARPQGLAPQGSTGLQGLQYQGPHLTQQMPMGHRLYLDQRVHVPQQPMQHAGTLPMQNQQYQQPSPQQGDMLHRVANHLLNHPPVYTEVQSGHPHDPGAGAQDFYYSTAQTATNAQVIPPQSGYHAQPTQYANTTQYASNPSNLQTQMQHTGHYAAHIQPSAVPHVGQKRGHQQVGCTYPNEHVGVYAYNHAQNQELSRRDLVCSSLCDHQELVSDRVDQHFTTMHTAPWHAQQMDAALHCSRLQAFQGLYLFDHRLCPVFAESNVSSQ